MPSIRHMILYGMLAATLIATLVVENSDDDIVEPVNRRTDSNAIDPRPKDELQTNTTNNQNAKRIAIDRENLINRQAKNLFPVRNPGGMQSANQPPPIAIDSATSPEIPFEYIGQQKSGKQTQVFIKYQDQVLIIKEGDIINSAYRVKKIKEDMIELVYLPTNQITVMNIRGEQP